MRVHAYAKINWMLNVISRRGDGYHMLDMLMQSVSLHDTLTLEPAQDIAACGDDGPLPDDNLVLRAARGYFECAQTSSGVHIRLNKRIPACSGLGGGSADAAAVVLALERMYHPLPSDVRQSLALRLGADVPFCLQGGLARVSGIGETVKPLTPAPSLALLLLAPSAGISTAKLFSSLVLPCPQADIGHAQNALLHLGAHALAPYLRNALEPAACVLAPQVAQLKQWLTLHGALGACMTGSGSCVFGLFASIQQAKEAQKNAPGDCFSAACETLPYGVKIFE